MSATLHNSSRDAGQSNPDQNKICQWYCCSCGQCFGQIYYKDHKDHDVSFDSSIQDNNLMNRLKYYSKIVYNQSEPSSVSDNERKNSADDDYFQFLPTPSSGLHSQGTLTLELSANKNYNYEGQRTLSLSSTSPSYQSIDQPINNESDSSRDEKLFSDSKDTATASDIVLRVPTRFTCHRCNHMMCPYCLKIRLKDLHRDHIGT